MTETRLVSKYPFNTKGYLASNQGVITGRTGKALKKTTSRGFNMITLSNDEGKGRSIRADEIIAHTFLGEMKETETVEHLNDNRLDDNLSNLKYTEMTDYLTSRHGNKWVQIKKRQGFYISTAGQVWSPYTWNTMAIGKQTAYETITIGTGTDKTMQIHNLVATAFIPNPDKKPCVYHIDGNSFNNNVENLEWLTQSEINYRVQHKLIGKPKKPNLVTETSRERPRHFVPYFEDTRYLITREGQVWDDDKNKYNTLYRNPDGYIRTKIGRDHKRVHLLVANTFLVRERPNQTEVNHKDMNKGNNNVTNLEWCSTSENCKHAMANRKEEKHKDKQIMMVDLETGEDLELFKGNKKAVRLLRARGITIESGSITNVCKGRGNSAGGYGWRKYLGPLALVEDKTSASLNTQAKPLDQGIPLELSPPSLDGNI